MPTLTLPRETVRLRVGQGVVFRSGDGGGCWKRGVVDSLTAGNVRICVGPGVWIWRSRRLCRTAEGEQ